MRIRKIDKEIFDQFFPNEKMKFLQATPDKKLRGFCNANDDIALFICESTVPKEYIIAFTQIMLRHKKFNVVMSKYKDKILVTMTKIEESPKSKTMVVEEKFDDEDDDCQHDDMPHAYTNGRWSPCPYCGSDRISTFMDGTAQCDNCKREFTYMRF